MTDFNLFFTLSTSIAQWTASAVLLRPEFFQYLQAFALCLTGSSTRRNWALHDKNVGMISILANISLSCIPQLHALGIKNLTWCPSSVQTLQFFKEISFHACVICSESICSQPKGVSSFCHTYIDLPPASFWAHAAHIEHCFCLKQHLPTFLKANEKILLYLHRFDEAVWIPISQKAF